jgi:cation diffusion facilitator CzcD-associated flavoprotein CzcO
MVSKYSDYDETGQWTIKTKDMKTEKVTDHVFDAVMICTGHHAEKNMPSFPGLSNFKGKVLHSSFHIFCLNSPLTCFVVVRILANHQYLNRKKKKY